MIVRLTAAAKLCKVDRTTLWRWSCADARVARCIFRPGWFIVERLAELGLCPKPDAPGTPIAPVSEVA